MKSKAATYEAMGMAAMLPGMQHLLELMQTEIDRMKEQLRRLQEPEEERAVGSSSEWLTIDQIARGTGHNKSAVASAAKRVKWSRRPIPNPGRGKPRVEYLRADVAKTYPEVLNGHEPAVVGPELPQQKRRMTPKMLKAMRASAAKARAALAAKHAAAAKPRKRGRTLPAQWDGWYTKQGAMKELDLGLSAIERLMRDKDLRTKHVRGPSGRDIAVVDPASLAAVKAQRNGVAA